MNYDKKCKWHKSCGYDFCHGEGICPEFEKGKSPMEFMLEEGWKKLLYGEWKHYCPECQESEVEHNA